MLSWLEESKLFLTSKEKQINLKCDKDSWVGKIWKWKEEIRKITKTKISTTSTTSHNLATKVSVTKDVYLFSNVYRLDAVKVSGIFNQRKLLLVSVFSR